MNPDGPDHIPTDYDPPPEAARNATGCSLILLVVVAILAGVLVWKLMAL
jgi:hypothetical protein